MSATAKYILYYNIITEDLYDENGSYMGNSAFNVFFDNIVNVELHYMTDTSSDDVSNWIPWTGLQGNTTGSSICFDDDYLHASLGSVSENSSAGSTILKVSSTLSENNVNPSDSLILYNADGTSVSLPYTGYTYASGVYSFELASALSTDVSTGLDVRVPQALLLKVYSDEIDQTEASTGVFKFSMNIMSHKLLNRLDYSNTTKVSGTFEHQIYSDGKNVATFTFPMSVTNLIDYRGNANIPADGTWADKAYVDSKIPTKVSELLNDAGYISELTDPVYTADKPLIALKLELFSKSFNDLLDVPNTIAGYGITDVSISDRIITIGLTSLEVPEVTADIVKTALGINSQTGSSLKYLNEKGNFVQISSVMSVNGVQADTSGNVSLNLESLVDIQELALLIKAVKSVNGVLPDETTLLVTLTADNLEATVYLLEVNVLLFLNTVVISINTITPINGEVTLDAYSIYYDAKDVASGTVAEKLLYILSNLGTDAIKTINGLAPNSETGNILIAFVKSVDGFTPNSAGLVLLMVHMDGSTITIYDAFETLRSRILQLEQGGGGGGGGSTLLAFNPPLSLDGNVVNIDMSFSNVTNTPTTLEGYGITDAHIVGKVITLGGNSIEVPEGGGSTYVLTKAAVDGVIGASATGSATKFYNQQGAFVSVDLKLYALKSELFSKKFNDLTDTPETLAGYGITDAHIVGKVITLGANSITIPDEYTYTLTKAAVDGVIGASAAGSATMFYNQQGAFVSVDFTGYATESFVTSQGYITGDALNGYATTTDVSTAVSTHNQSTDAHTALFSGKENVGVAKGLVDSHNQSTDAHTALFSGKENVGVAKGLVDSHAVVTASDSVLGHIKVDNDTITVDENGVATSHAIGHNIFDIFYSMSSKTPAGAMDLSLGTLIASCNTVFPDFWNACLLRRGNTYMFPQFSGSVYYYWQGDNVISEAVSGDGSAVCYYDGKIYVLAKGECDGHATPPPLSLEWRLFIVPTELWDALKLYSVGDTVLYNGLIWCARPTSIAGDWAGVGTAPGTADETGYMPWALYNLPTLIIEPSIRLLTEDEWQTEVAANGSCGAFVVDETAKSVRLPKITHMVQPGDIGVFTEAGLPNIYGTLNFRCTDLSTYPQLVLNNTGVFYEMSYIDSTAAGVTIDSTAATRQQVKFSAEEWNAIYGNSTTVQPPAVGAKLYIQVYTSAVPASVAQAAEFINMLEAKADKTALEAKADKAELEAKADKTDLSAYLPLSGGTMTGGIVTSNVTDTITSNAERIIMSGGSTYTKGGNLRLYGDGYDGSMVGGFALVTFADETQKAILAGTPDGLLRWGGIISGAAYSHGLHLYAGTNGFDGATLQLFPPDHSNYAGRFYLRASTKASSSSTGSACDLVGLATGALTWGGKSVDCIHASGTYYIRYVNGIQICWGTISASNTLERTVTLPAAFVNTAYAIAISQNGSSSADYVVYYIRSKTKSNFVATCVSGGTWIAIGRWK